MNDDDVKHSTTHSKTKNVLKNNNKTKFLKHINYKLYKYGTKLTKGGYPGLISMYGLKVDNMVKFEPRESLYLYQKHLLISKYCSLSSYAYWLQ